MVSVAKPRCARGQNCSHIRDFPHIDKPPKVAYDGALCDRCRYNTNDSEVPEEYKELLRTAGQRIRATQSLMRSQGMTEGENYRDLLTRLSTALAMTEAAYLEARRRRDL